jgi:hypothetical protein
MSKRRGFGYTPPPKSRAVALRQRTGVAERLTSVARDKAEQADADNEPLRDAPPRLTLAERTMLRRQTLPMGLDLDAQVARDREAAMHRPNSPAFLQTLMDELGLSEMAARMYALALRSVEIPEPRPTSIAIASPTGHVSDRLIASVIPTGHAMRPDPGWAPYYPANIPPAAILGLPASTQPSPQQRLEAVQALETAHLEWEALGLLEWTQRGSWGRLRV